MRWSLDSDEGVPQRTRRTHKAFIPPGLGRVDLILHVGMEKLATDDPQGLGIDHMNPSSSLTLSASPHVSR